MSNFKMDIAHLTPLELDYELKIRGVSGLTTVRTKLNALRDLINREDKGLETTPKDSSSILKSSDEISACSLIYDDILSKIDAAWKSGDQLGINAGFTRFNYLQSRLERIRPSNTSEGQAVYELLDVVYDAIYRLGNERINPGNSPSNASRKTVQRVDSRMSEGQTNRSSSAAGYTQTASDQINMIATSVNNTSPNESFEGAVGYARVTNPGISAWLQNENDVAANTRDTGNIVRELQQLDLQKNLNNAPNKNLNIQKSQSLNNRPNRLENDNRKNYDLSYRDGRPPVVHENISGYSNQNSNSATNREDGAQRVNEGNLVYQNSYHQRPVRKNQANANVQFHNNFDILDPPSSYVNVRAENNQWSHIDHGLNRNRSYWNEYPRNGDNMLGSELQRPHANNNDYPVQRNQGFYEQDRRNYDENFMRNQNYPLSYNQPGVPNLNSRGNQHWTGYTRRRNVPVNAWGISFSGDGRGMHLHDFLTQLKVYQRSEQIPSQELLYLIVHLLSGQAKLWYLSRYDSFQSWDHLEAAIRREFLPENYEYALLSEVSKRKQKSNESFSEYITHMMATFKCISIPIPEQHILFIVRDNLLPKYADAIAPLEIQNLAHLSEVCRRIDNTTFKRQPSLPFQSFSGYDRNIPRKFSSDRQVNSLDCSPIENVENQVASDECYRNEPANNGFGMTDELCPIHVERNRKPRGQMPANRLGSNNSGRESTLFCWNCRKWSDHPFRACKEARTIFCYRCGQPDTKAPNCKCSGNVKGNLDPPGNVREPADQSPRN